MDAATTGYDTWYDYKPSPGKRSQEMTTAVATADTLLWQCTYNMTVWCAHLHSVSNLFAIFSVGECHDSWRHH